MSIHNILTNAGEWLRGEGPHSQIVVSSRVRLARNLKNHAFPGWAKKVERLQILEAIKPRVEELPEMSEAFSVYSTSRRLKSRCLWSAIWFRASTRPRAWVQPW
jgi:protein-arginine kinase